MLQQALENEVEECLAKHAQFDEKGHCLVVCNEVSLEFLVDRIDTVVVFRQIELELEQDWVEKILENSCNSFFQKTIHPREWLCPYY